MYIAQCGPGMFAHSGQFMRAAKSFSIFGSLFFVCFDGAVGGICCCSFVLWSALASPIFFFTHPNYADTELFHTLSVRMCMSTYLLLFLHATCVVNFFRTLAILQA